MQADDAREAVDVLARLAGLDLSVERRQRLAGFLEAVLDSAEDLKSVDLEGVEPPTIFRAMVGPAEPPDPLKGDGAR